MKIAVNTRFLLSNCLERYGYFIHETFKKIVRSHPGHEFIFIFDRPFHPSFIYAGNVTPVVIGPPARHPLLWKFWSRLRRDRLTGFVHFLLRCRSALLFTTLLFFISRQILKSRIFISIKNIRPNLYKRRNPLQPFPHFRFLKKRSKAL